MGAGRGRETALGWELIHPRTAELLSLSRLVPLSLSHQTPAPRSMERQEFYTQRSETLETTPQALP